METWQQYKDSINSNINSSMGYNRFIGVITARFTEADLFEKFRVTLKYIFDIHKSIYSMKNYSLDRIKAFEETVCLGFIKDFDELCSKSKEYTYESFCKELGKRLNGLSSEYNKTYSELKSLKETVERERLEKARRESKRLEKERQEAARKEKEHQEEARKAQANQGAVRTGNTDKTRAVGNNKPDRTKNQQLSSLETAINVNGQCNKTLPSISGLTGQTKTVENRAAIKTNSGIVVQPGLKFYVNPSDRTFSKTEYMDEIDNDPTCIPKLFEKRLSVALTQFPDKLLKNKIAECIKYHRSIESFIGEELDAIKRFENLVTCYYIGMTYDILTIPQPLADTPEKFKEVDDSLIRATDEYLGAIKELINKFMKKVDMTNQSKLDTFSTIVNGII